MPSLREFLPVRHREIVAEVADAHLRLRDLSKELEDLRLAAESVGIVLLEGEPTDNTEEVEAKRVVEQRSQTDETIKEAAVAVIREAGHGMTASDILAAINKRLGVNYSRTSLSPQLSRLKQEGSLDLDGNAWSMSRDDALGIPEQAIVSDLPSATNDKKPNQWAHVLGHMVNSYPAVLTNDDLVRWGQHNGYGFSRHQLRAALFNWRKRGHVEAIADGQHRVTQKGAEAINRLLDLETKEGPAVRPNLL